MQSNCERSSTHTFTYSMSQYLSIRRYHNKGSQEDSRTSQSNYFLSQGVTDANPGNDTLATGTIDVDHMAQFKIFCSMETATGSSQCKHKNLHQRLFSIYEWGISNHLTNTLTCLRGSNNIFSHWSIPYTNQKMDTNQKLQIC